MNINALKKGLELVCHVHADVPRKLIGDSTRLRQVFVNLIGNAIKFTRQGEITVEVLLSKESRNRSSMPSAEGASKEKTKLMCIVRDTGIGIKKDVQSRIFESFTQADNSTTRRFGGTGLGLTITAKIVELMGGQIWVESELGQGSEFKFTPRFRLPEAQRPDALPPAGEKALPEKLVGQVADSLLITKRKSTGLAVRELLRDLGLKTIQQWNAMDHPGWQLEAQPALAAQPVVWVDSECFESLDQLRQWLQDSLSSSECRAVILHPADQTEAPRLQNAGIACASKPLTRDAACRALREVYAHADAQCHAAAQGKRQPRSDVSLKILLAEDVKVNQKVAVGLLKLMGHEIDVAENGREVIEMLGKQPAYDVILMDVEMPELDGIEATKIIREEEKATGAHIPILAMTAHAVREFETRCHEAGMDGFITKPFEPAVIKKRLDELGSRALANSS